MKICVPRSIDVETSRRFAAMSFVCACMVVFIHIGLVPDRGTLTWWFYHLIGYDGLLRAAVPFFFLASGFFLAGSIRGRIGEWYGGVLRKRVRTLLVPYVIWNVISVCVAALMLLVAKKVGYEVHSGVSAEFTGSALVNYMGLNVFETPHLSVLWYVRSLMVFVLVSPVLVVSYRWEYSRVLSLPLFIICGALAAVTISNRDLTYLNGRFFTTEGLFFFWLGIGVRLGCFKEVSLPTNRFWIGVLAIGLLLVRVVLDWAGHSLWAYWAGWFGVPVVMYWLWLILPTHVWPKWAVTSSFALYLVHLFFVNALAGVVGAFGVRDVVLQSLTFYFVRGLFVVAMSLIAIRLFNRGLPHIWSCLLGGR